MWSQTIKINRDRTANGYSRERMTDVRLQNQLLMLQLEWRVYEKKSVGQWSICFHNYVFVWKLSVGYE